MQIGWNFPNNGGGSKRGVSEAGIETFTGKEIQSLAREICQNSLDAASSKNSEKVIVEFERKRIETSTIPGYEEYKNIFEKARTYYSNRESEKTKERLDKACKDIGASSTYVLRISDYNTVGLLDPFGDSDKGWNALTKIDGGSTKSGGDGGSFGIGKNAAFCNSDLRLVFYRTLNEDGERAAQGVSRFVSFPENLEDIRRTMTTGVGFYGNMDFNQPLESIKELDELDERKEVGTDVFVYGFSGGVDWDKEIIVQILENFIMSIYNNLLEIRVNGKIINKENLGEYVEEYKDEAKTAVGYYKVLTSKETNIINHNFHDMGELYLRVLVDQKENFNRKIMVTRTSGMKILDIKNISRTITFTGILEMKGEKLNAYFRELENPKHDNWETSRCNTDKKQAKEYLHELKQWVKDQVYALGEHASEEELDVDGLSDILQMESNSGSLNDNEKEEPLKDTIGKVEIQPRTISPKRAKDSIDINDKGNSGGTEDVNGRIDKDGDEDATRILHGHRHRKIKDKHKGFVDDDGDDIIHKHKAGKKQGIDNVRIMKLDARKYRVVFVSTTDILNGHLDIVTVGENQKNIPLKIEDAYGVKGCNDVVIEKMGVKFSGAKGGNKVSIDFYLANEYDYAMEVSIYEYN